MKWQPIETAPMDGTRVLIFAHRIEVAHYHPDFGWMRMSPTHWMPLPDPPKKRKAHATNPERRQLTDEFSKAFEQRFGRKYLFNGSRDGKAVTDLLANASKDEVMHMAITAWNNITGPNAFECKQAVTLYGLRDKWNHLLAIFSGKSGRIASGSVKGENQF